MRGRPAREAGVALIIVLWAIVLLMFVVAHIEAAGRSEAQLGLNLRRAAALQAQADGAIAIAAFHLLDHSAAHWPANGQVHMIRIPGRGITRAIRIAMIDQSGRIDLNSAPPALLQALIAETGVNPARAGAIARAIAEWRAPNGNSGAERAIAAKYRAAGRSFGPPGAPFESLDELALVKGVSPQLAVALHPDLTVLDRGRTNLAFANAAVKRAIAAAGIGQASFTPHPAGLRVVVITATAIGKGDTAFTRRAIVRIGAQSGGWLRVLTWTNPSLSHATQS